MDTGHVEPYVRCCECQRMEDVTTVANRPGCLCGSKRFRPLSYLLNEKEAERVKASHPVYFATEFELSEEDDTCLG